MFSAEWKPRSLSGRRGSPCSHDVTALNSCSGSGGDAENGNTPPKVLVLNLAPRLDATSLRSPIQSLSFQTTPPPPSTTPTMHSQQFHAVQDNCIAFHTIPFKTITARPQCNLPPILAMKGNFFYQQFHGEKKEKTYSQPQKSERKVRKKNIEKKIIQEERDEEQMKSQADKQRERCRWKAEKRERETKLILSLQRRDADL